METAPEIQTKRTEEIQNVSSRQVSPRIPTWLWVILPIAVGIVSYIQAEPIIGRRGHIVESDLHPWLMACFGLFLGWSLLLNFRDGKWLGLIGAATWYGLFFLLIVQEYHDFVLSNIADIRVAEILWLVPGALFALYWLISVIKMKQYTHPQRGERLLPRSLLLVIVLLSAWLLLNFAGVFDPESRYFNPPSWTERATMNGFAVLVAFFIPLLSALRYEMGDGKSLSFCVNFAVSWSYMVAVGTGLYLGITDIVSDPTSKFGILVMTIFMFILLAVFLVVDLALVLALFFPKTAEGLAVDKASLQKAWKDEPKKKTAPAKAEEVVSNISEPQKEVAEQRYVMLGVRRHPNFFVYLHPASHYGLGILVVLLGAMFIYFGQKMDSTTISGALGEQALVMLGFGTLFLASMLLFNTYRGRKERKQWLMKALKAQTTIANRDFVMRKGADSLPNEKQYRQYFLGLEKIPDQLAVVPKESVVLTRVNESQYKKYEDATTVSIYYSPQDPFTFLLEDEV